MSSAEGAAHPTVRLVRVGRRASAATEGRSEAW